MARFLAIALTLAMAATSMAATIPNVTPETKPFNLSARQEDDIVGGTTASSGEFPYIVSLSEGGSHFCGGVLLNAYTVITAAHCSVGQTASSVKVRAGSLQWASGGTQVSVSAIKYNSAYSSSTIDNDVAVWHLASPIATSSTIGYATLPAQGSDPAAGVTTTVAGWGTTSASSGSIPAALRKVSVPIISRTDCRADYGTSAITNQMICAGVATGGKDSCSGDSGGPLVDASTGVLIGLVSWGQGCADADYPGVYTRVGSFVDWINTNSWTS